MRSARSPRTTGSLRSSVTTIGGNTPWRSLRAASSAMISRPRSPERKAIVELVSRAIIADPYRSHPQFSSISVFTQFAQIEGKPYLTAHFYQLVIGLARSQQLKALAN